ncbi:uncharacterized protein K452DRAFT_124205 [Aplosporella prunicola CBS 121167]|uniref:Uncharacterized protein n=1 Tax=Aplosporella prunicola CBS 121167 TaxID=1176127 RepID=A0A6A6BNQ1_9PEZI|nr:uncharacterized protein K452DRAFT_124205 [Aplosporella prunicola CBS 121167]KAF2145706.1 hypothetical protein K452DRAFT_124205 [Aplosporella prunicola CBS 121167]
MLSGVILVAVLGRESWQSTPRGASGRSVLREGRGRSPPCDSARKGTKTVKHKRNRPAVTQARRRGSAFLLPVTNFPDGRRQAAKARSDLGRPKAVCFAAMVCAALLALLETGILAAGWHRAQIRLKNQLS